MPIIPTYILMIQVISNNLLRLQSKELAPHGFQSGRTARDPAPPLPLIMCPRCGAERTITYVSGTEANPGIRFYKCPKQGENGTCDFFLWDQHYAYFITGVGINLLIEAVGGSTNSIIGISGLIRDIKSVAMNTFVVCVLILAILFFQIYH